MTTWTESEWRNVDKVATAEVYRAAGFKFTGWVNGFPQFRHTVNPELIQSLAVMRNVQPAQLVKPESVLSEEPKRGRGRPKK